jgi:hypothetical protein
MAPVAYGALASIAGMVFISTFAGVVIGTVFWRNGIRWGLLCIAGYLALAPALYEAPWRGSTLLNGPPLLLTFLITHLTARALHARGKRLIAATITSSAAGILSAFVYMILFRALIWEGPTTASWIALAVDVLLASLALFKRHAWAVQRVS